MKNEKYIMKNTANNTMYIVETLHTFIIIQWYHI